MPEKRQPLKRGNDPNIDAQQASVRSGPIYGGSALIGTRPSGLASATAITPGPLDCLLHSLRRPPMANLGSILKSEITRLARKEVKTQTDQLRKANATYRREIAELKRQMATLARQVKAAGGDRASALKKNAGPIPIRFVAKGLKSLRARLDLSASDFGKLAGVSGQSIYNWENGKTTPRPSQLAVLATLRSLLQHRPAPSLVTLCSLRFRQLLCRTLRVTPSPRFFMSVRFPLLLVNQSQRSS